MSQDPLKSIRRQQSRPKQTFPDPQYRESLLVPSDDWVRETLFPFALDAWLAHGVVLAETRSIDGAAAAGAISNLLSTTDIAEFPESFAHALAAVEAIATAGADGALRLGIAREEILACASRMLLRERILGLLEATLGFRSRLAELSAQHLTTLIVVTSGGQSVQPTSLGHYLVARLGPFQRATRRIRQTFERVNASPAGSVAGVSTAVPVRRELSADLLGFDGIIENTLDALSSVDWLAEIAGVVTAIGAGSDGLLTDLEQWARDDVGTMVPGPGFVHPSTGQPQRHDPAVLDHLRVRVAAISTLPTRIEPLLVGKQMLRGEAGLVAAVRLVDDGLKSAIDTLRIMGQMLSSIEVNRSLFATRTHRGFSTSSELAELLTIDFKLAANVALALTERVVAEASQAGLDAATIRPDLIDRIALQMLGREIGIEPEVLSRCLAPKRFLERRDVLGGPAPVSVSEALERETFASRQDAAWLRDARGRIESARATLASRATDIAASSGADAGE